MKRLFLSLGFFLPLCVIFLSGCALAPEDASQSAAEITIQDTPSTPGPVSDADLEKAHLTCEADTGIGAGRPSLIESLAKGEEVTAQVRIVKEKGKNYLYVGDAGYCRLDDPRRGVKRYSLAESEKK